MATTEHQIGQQEIIDMDQRYVMRTYGRLPVVFVRGKGVRLWDASGKEYLDFLAGIAVNGLGHCHPKVVEAIREQAGTLIHTSNLYYTEAQPKLARMLVEWSDFDRVFFCNSGAEANEAAIKLARKWARLHHSDAKFEIVAALNSFHGRTMGAVTATAQEKYQKWFAPLVPGFKYVPYNDVAAIEKAVGKATCAVIMEPVQGESGVYPATKTFLKAAREACDEHGALLIFDEVQTGLGRTGKLFAYEHYGIVPDVMTLAKSLGGGFPIGACLARNSAADTFEPSDHASTFGGSPLACAAAIAAVNALHEEGLVENARDTGEYMRSKLQSLKRGRKSVSAVRGLGLMLAIEFSTPVARQVAARCLDNGLILNAIGDRILRFLPPLIVTKDDVEAAFEILDSALGEEL